MTARPLPVPLLQPVHEKPPGTRQRLPVEYLVTGEVVSPRRPAFAVPHEPLAIVLDPGASCGAPAATAAQRAALFYLAHGDEAFATAWRPGLVVDAYV